MLDLNGNNFKRLPPALTTATSLRELSFAMNAHLVLSKADVERTLLPLPRLRRLYMNLEHTAPDVRALLAHAAPQLQVIEGHSVLTWQGPE